LSLPPESVAGRWVHAHEEDTETEMVFRPADRPLPPSRGRAALEFRPDGTYVEEGPGPTDRPEEKASGTWSLEEGDLVLAAPESGERRVLRIASAEPDRLVVKK
jgi:hypothetical protein